MYTDNQIRGLRPCLSNSKNITYPMITVDSGQPAIDPFCCVYFRNHTSHNDQFARTFWWGWDNPFALDNLILHYARPVLITIQIFRCYHIERICIFDSCIFGFKQPGKYSVYQIRLVRVPHYERAKRGRTNPFGMEFGKGYIILDCPQQQFITPPVAVE